MGRQSSLIRTLALINGNAFSKFNATAFAKKSSAKLSRGFAEKTETKSAERLKAVVFQPEVQQKQRKKQDIFTEAGKFDDWLVYMNSQLIQSYIILYADLN